MRSRLRLLAALALSAGCSGKANPPDGGVGDGGGGYDGGLTVGAVCRRLSTAQCAVLARCFPEFQSEDETVCRLRYEAGCVDGLTSADPWVESGAITFTADRAMACAARLEGAACPPALPPGYYLGWALPFADCFGAAPVYQGELPAGSVCTSAYSCVDGTSCVSSWGACSGVCLTPSMKGESCGAGCAAGLHCDYGGTPDPTDDRCQPLSGADDACANSYDCDPGLRCVNNSCVKPGQTGAFCFWDPTRVSTCDDGLVCDVLPFIGDAGSCAPRAKAGEPCHFHTTCEGGLICDGLDFSAFPKVLPAPGVCGKVKQKGEACKGTRYAQWFGNPCAPGLQCSTKTGTCDDPPHLGDPCEVPGDCAGIDIYCRPLGSGTQGLCSRAPEIGEQCAFPLLFNPDYGLHCAEGWCDTHGTGLCHASDAPLGAMCDQAGQCASLRCAAYADGKKRCAEPCPKN